MKNPLFNWLKKRSSGVLLHPTALPSSYGIGNLGSGAYKFIDYLNNCSFSHWQICPLGSTGYGNSPYQCFSAFAGNLNLIDWDDLISLGLLRYDELLDLTHLPNDYCDFNSFIPIRNRILRLTLDRFNEQKDQQLVNEYNTFSNESNEWLQPYAEFRALKTHFNESPLKDWPISLRCRKSSQRNSLNKLDKSVIQFHCWGQFLFFRQWKKLKNYAQKKQISIIGDMPIYISADSADVWENPDLFILDNEFNPECVAGVPPDYFSESGQLWGNPLYNWELLRKQNYSWWMKRLRQSMDFFDITRLDHFRAFEAFWSIGSDKNNAIDGKWVPGPGISFFELLAKKYPSIKLIAEDLGMIDDNVRSLLKETGLPGMSVLQFAFGGSSDNLYLPHHHIPEQVIYTGTHDNDTTYSWYQHSDENTKDHLRRYLRVSGENVAWDLIRSAMQSPARLAIIPMQDLLCLDYKARFNVPGTTEGNWQWRMDDKSFESHFYDSGAYIMELNQCFYR